MTRIVVTLFRDEYAKSKREVYVTPEELAAGIARTSAPTKAKLPLLKLGTFGDVPTPKGCLRSNANLEHVSGTEIDYDREQLPFDNIIARLRAAGYLAIAFTSPSHTPEKPRWRLLLPFAALHPPEVRRPSILRAAAALGLEADIGPDTLTNSQSYYFGRIAGDDNFRIELLDGDPVTVVDAPQTPAVKYPVGLAATCNGLTRYGRAALASAQAKIRAAPLGKQRLTINFEAYTIGRLCAAGGVPRDIAAEVLVKAAASVPDLIPGKPWKDGEAAYHTLRAFEHGLAVPRAKAAEPDPNEFAEEFIP